MIIDEPTRRRVFESAQRGGGGVNSKTEGGPDGSGTKQKVWGVGEMEFEALMRMLDNAVRMKHITTFGSTVRGLSWLYIITPENFLIAFYVY